MTDGSLTWLNSGSRPADTKSPEASILKHIVGLSDVAGPILQLS